MTSPPTADERVVVVGDAHLGSADARDEAAFHEFLEAVPQLGTRLLIMGDLFDFWFEYLHVIPRRPFKTLAEIAILRDKGMVIEMFGGNHDRWGGSFWTRDLGVPFYSDGSAMTLAGRRAWVHHGDGLSEHSLGGRLLHRLTRSPFMQGLFRALHPDFSFKLVGRLSGSLRDTTPDYLNGAAEAQERYARDVLAKRPELQLVVLAHTHRQRLVEVQPGRFYLNAGQWMVDRHYAVVTAEKVRLLQWPARP